MILISYINKIGKEMSDIIQEIDEALRKEKAERFWNDHKIAIISSFILLIIAASSWSAFKQYNTYINGKQTQKLITALESDNPIEEITKLSKELKDPIKSISLMNEAGILLGKKEISEAKSIYNSIYSDKSSPDIIKELALLMLTRISISEDNFDIQKASKDLDKLISSKNSPWKYHAMLEKSVINAHFIGDYETAIQILDKIIKEKSVPMSLTQRANSLKHIYKIKAAEKTKVQ